MEIWKEVDGWPGYFVSESGDVKSTVKGYEHILKQSFDGAKQYLMVTLSRNGVLAHVNVHRLVASAFVKNENPSINTTVDHINCIKTDNRACNLEWVSLKENLRRARENGLTKPPPTFKGKFGKNHNRSKGYVLQNPSGGIETYYSGLEFTRKTGISHSILSYATTTFSLPYEIKRGKLRGYTVLKYFYPYKRKTNRHKNCNQ